MNDHVKHALITYFSLIHSREVIVTSSVLSCEAAKVTIEMYCIVLYVLLENMYYTLLLLLGKFMDIYSAL